MEKYQSIRNAKFSPAERREQSLFTNLLKN